MTFEHFDLKFSTTINAGLSVNSVVSGLQVFIFSETDYH